MGSVFSIFSRCLLMSLLRVVVLGALHIFCWLILATFSAYSTHCCFGSEMGLGLPSFGYHRIICDMGDFGRVRSCLCDICAQHSVALWHLPLYVCLWEMEKGT